MLALGRYASAEAGTEFAFQENAGGISPWARDVP